MLGVDLPIVPAVICLPRMQGVGAEQMNAGEQPVIGMSDVFPEPGTFTVKVCNLLIRSWCNADWLPWC